MKNLSPLSFALTFLVASALMLVNTRSVRADGSLDAELSRLESEEARILDLLEQSPGRPSPQVRRHSRPSSSALSDQDPTVVMITHDQLLMKKRLLDHQQEIGVEEVKYNNLSDQVQVLQGKAHDLQTRVSLFSGNTERLSGKVITLAETQGVETPEMLDTMRSRKRLPAMQSGYNFTPPAYQVSVEIPTSHSWGNVPPSTVEFAGDSYAADHPFAYARFDSVMLYLRPDPSSYVLEKVSFQSRILVEMRRENWYRIVTEQGNRGWIRNTDLVFGPSYHEAPGTFVRLAAYNPASDRTDWEE